MTDWWTSYIGLPFGEGPGEVTCWSLIRAIYARHLEVDLPGYGDISARDLMRVARQMETGKDGERWCEPSRPGVFDVVLMRSARGGRAVCHVGLIADVARVLHAEEATGTVIVPIDHFTIRGRIAGYRRYLS
jgi:cell wall-associated NlpC family hydrolase